MLISVCALGGLVAVAGLVVRAVLDLWKHLLRPSLERAGTIPEYPWPRGQWAVITGATDGIGKAFAFELASKGLDIVLISRSLDKLKATAKEIESNYGVKTKVVQVDFTDDLHIYQKIRNEIEHLEIGMLVNNVGASYKFFEYFTKVPNGDELMESIYRLNIVSYLMMTRIVLPGMQKRRSGIILSVGSASGCKPSPFLSAYGASKHYQEYLIMALREEYKNSGVVIQFLIPHYVVTKMSKIKTVSLLTPSARNYVRWALHTVGKDSITYGYPVHWAMIRIWEKIGFLFKVAFWVSFEYFFGKTLMKFFKKKHGLFKNQQNHCKG